MISSTKYYTTFKTDWGYCGFVYSKKTMHRFYLPYRSKLLLQQAIFNTFGVLPFCCDGQKDIESRIVDYFSGNVVEMDIKNEMVDGFALRISGETVFAQQVLKTLMTVSVGDTITYGQLAVKAGYQGSARAVGSVMRRNQFPLLIPCHRVVPAGTKGVGQFSAMGGTSFKKKLLAHEAMIAMEVK